ncbi:MAG: hypothetical protein FD163_250 [Hyphomonadaceae bacterium]|nr:MAG: hypothetical protein FD128_201 [Hyphomonadaceae bacterium]KAF0186975.1 MAG: hypothetical protein FD163_250 [Hyphomonadaceae bacterium]
MQRRKWLFGALGFCVGCIGGGSVFASPIDAPAQAAFQAGNWAEAARLAEAANNEDNLIFAARAIATQIGFERPSRSSAQTMRRFRRLIDLALALNPQNIQAKLLDATYDLFRARQLGPVRAFVDGAATRGKRKLETLIRLSPNLAEAHGLLGNWHYEALRLASPRTANAIGASEARGRQAFARARVISPNDISFPFLEANSVLLLKPSENAAYAIILLQGIAHSRATNAWERTIKSRSQQLMALLQIRDIEGANNLALSWL